MAKVTVCILFLAAFLWGTEALPLGATDVLVGVLLYLFAILPIDEISKAYMKDAVFFIFGILAVAVGVAKTGLDKRIGLILLSPHQEHQGLRLRFSSHACDFGRISLRARPGGAFDPRADGYL